MSCARPEVSCIELAEQGRNVILEKLVELTRKDASVFIGRMATAHSLGQFLFKGHKVAPMYLFICGHPLMNISHPS